MWPQLPEKNGWSIVKKSIGKVLVYVGDLNWMNATIGYIQEKNFYEVTSELERRLCEKDLK